MNKIKHFYNNNRQLFYIYVTVFFLVAGILQYAIGWSYVTKLNPLVISLITAAVILFWDLHPKVKLYLSLYAMLVGFIAELIGVNTGLLFGNYSYSDSSLSVKVFGVPLLLGIMWLLVTVSAWQIAKLSKFGRVGTILLAGVLVVLFDFVLEQYATAFGLWTWDNGIIPVLNYITWFIVSVIIFIGFSKYANNIKPGSYGILIMPIMMAFFWLMLVF